MQIIHILHFVFLILYLYTSLIMAESRVTEPRKRFVEILGQHTRVPFNDLKKELVGKK